MQTENSEVCKSCVIHVGLYECIRQAGTLFFQRGQVALHILKRAAARAPIRKSGIGCPNPMLRNIGVKYVHVHVHAEH